MEKYVANLLMYQFKGGDNMDISDREKDHGAIKVDKGAYGQIKASGSGQCRNQSWWKISDTRPIPSTPIQDSSQPMEETPDTPKTDNIIQPLVKNAPPPQVSKLSTFTRSNLTQTDILITFNPQNG
jgi:hypothetical protein